MEANQKQCFKMNTFSFSRLINSAIYCTIFLRICQLLKHPRLPCPHFSRTPDAPLFLSSLQVTGLALLIRLKQIFRNSLWNRQWLSKLILPSVMLPKAFSYDFWNTDSRSRRNTVNSLCAQRCLGGTATYQTSTQKTHIPQKKSNF